MLFAWLSLYLLYILIIAALPIIPFPVYFVIWHVKLSMILTSKLTLLWKMFAGTINACEFLNCVLILFGKLFACIISVKSYQWSHQ